MEIQKSKFDNLDYGTKATTVNLELIRINLDPDIMIKDYATAYSNELMRLNPTRFNSEPIKEDELFEYFKGLLKLRIEMVEGNCSNFRQAKRLFIPSWIQFTLTKVGEVIDRSLGLRFIPQLDHEYKLDQLLLTSNKLGAYMSDGLSVHLDAFPRDWQGDYNVMSMAIVNDYVMSINDKGHAVHSYVAGFLGQKLAEEQLFAALYRVRYDEYQFILSQLISDRGTIL